MKKYNDIDKSLLIKSAGWQTQEYMRQVLIAKLPDDRRQQFLREFPVEHCANVDNWTDDDFERFAYILGG